MWIVVFICFASCFTAKSILLDQAPLSFEEQLVLYQQFFEDILS